MSVRLDHVNMTVNNIDESIHWYQKIFGFEKVEGGLTPQGHPWAIIAIQDSMISMSEYQRIAADENKDTSAHRVYHFGFRIDDADQWRNKIRQHGLKLYYDGEIKYPHSRSWYVHDPSGHEIEVSCTDGGPLKFPSHPK